MQRFEWTDVHWGWLAECMMKVNGLRYVKDQLTEACEWSDELGGSKVCGNGKERSKMKDETPFSP